MVDQNCLYRIISRTDPSKAIEIAGNIAGDREGNHCIATNVSNSAKQAFSIVRNEDGTYCIRSFFNPQCVLTYYPYEDAEDEYLYLWLAPIHPNTSYPGLCHYYLEDLGNGTLLVKAAAHTAHCLHPSHYLEEGDYRCDLCPNGEGAIWKWVLERIDKEILTSPLSLPDSSTGMGYRFVNASNPSLAIGLDSTLTECASLTIRPNNYSAEQLFIMRSLGSGVYCFLSYSNSQVALTAFTLNYRGMVGGAPYQAASNQKWTLVGAGNGSYKLVSYADSTWKLDTSGPAVIEGVPGILWANANSDSQRWLLEEVTSGFDMSGLGNDDTLCRIKNAGKPNLVFQFDSEELVSGYRVKPVSVAASSSQIFFVGYDAFFSAVIHWSANPGYVLTAAGEARDNLILASTESSSSLQGWMLYLAERNTYRMWLNGDEGTLLLGTNADYPAIGVDCALRPCEERRNSASDPDDYGSTWDRQTWSIEEIDLLKQRDGKVFQLRNAANPQLVAQFDSTTPSDGDSIHLKYDSADQSQLFTMRVNENGTVTFLSYANSDVALEATGFSDNGGVRGKTANSSAAQTWRLFLATGGAYRIVNAQNPLYVLDSTGTPPQYNSQLVMWSHNDTDAQQWILEEVANDGGQTEPEAVVRLRSYCTPSLVAQLDAATPAANVGFTMAEPDGGNDQLFRMIRHSDDTYSFVCMVEGASNTLFALTAPQYSLGASAMCTSYAGGSINSNQKWRLVGCGDGIVHLLNCGNLDYMLDTQGSITAVSSDCIVYTRNNGTTQRWIIEYYDPTNPNPSIYAGEYDSISETESYRIRNVSNPKLVLQLDDVSTNAFVTEAYQLDDSEYRQFTIRDNLNGSYSFLSVASPTIALTYDSSTSRVVGATDQGLSTQCWNLVRLGEGSYHLKNVASGTLLLDAATNNWCASEHDQCTLTSNDGGNRQRWIIEMVQEEESGGGDEPEPGDTGEWETLPLAYRIRNVSNTSLIMQFDSSTPTDGVGTSVDVPDGGYNQLFTIHPNSDGTCSIRSLANDAIALTATLPHADYATIKGKTYTGASNQHWKIARQSTGDYRILNADNNSWMLDTRGGPSYAGAECIQWTQNTGTTQRWTLEPVVIDEDAQTPVGTLSAIRLKNLSNQSVVAQVDSDTPASGTAIVMRTPDDTDKQVFTVANLSGESCNLLSYAAPTLAMTASGLSTNAPIYAVTLNSASNQTWKLIMQTDGSYHIFCGTSSQMLDTTGTPTTSTSSCVLWYDNSGTTQKWLVEPVKYVEGGDEPEPGDTGEWETLPLAYRIRNVSNTSLIMQFDSSTPTDGVGTSVDVPDGGYNQLFTIHPNSDGTCSIRSLANDAIALTATLPHADYATIKGKTYTGASNQHWKIARQSTGDYRILNADNNSWMLDTRGGPSYAGAECIQWTQNTGTTQRWTLEPVVIDEDAQTPVGTLSAIRLKNLSNQSVVAQVDSDTPASGTAIVMRTPDDTDKQVFTVANLSGESCNLLSYAAPTLAMTASGLSTNAPIYAVTLNSASNQTWKLIMQTDGSYHIFCGTSSQMLDTTGTPTTSTSSCVLWYDNSGTTQKWLVEPVKYVENENTNNENRQMPYLL